MTLIVYADLFHNFVKSTRIDLLHFSVTNFL